MLTSVQIEADILTRIANLFYHRPLMYGGTPEGVDLLAYYLIEVWATIHERGDDLLNVKKEVAGAKGCDAAGFPGHYFRTHPKRDIDGCVKYVIRCWKEVSEKLEIPIPKDRVIQELRSAGFSPFDSD